MTDRVIQRMMREAPRGQPLDMEMLKSFGVSIAMANRLVDSGWMARLSAGAYLLTGDSPARDGAIAYLGRRISGLHVGGRTALAWHGVRHNLPLRERVVLWGCSGYRFPVWVNDVMLYSYQTTQLFSHDLPYERYLKTMPGQDAGVLVSVPERALLELISDVGEGQTLEKVENLFASVRHMRRPILTELLSHCRIAKVAMILRTLARRDDRPWAADVHELAIRMIRERTRTEGKTL